MTIPYSQLTHDQLLSAIAERDDQLRVALGRIKELEAHLFEIKSKLHASQERYKKLEGERDGAGIRLVGFEGLLTTHKTVLKECVSLLPLIECKCDTASFGGYTCPRCETIAHATALLENTEPSQHNNPLPGLREAWRILNVAPEEDLAFKVGRLMERIKELEK